MYLTKAQALVDKGTRCSTKKFAEMSRRADKVLHKIRVGRNLLHRYNLQRCARARARGKAFKAARKKKSKGVAAALAGTNSVQNIGTERAALAGAMSLPVDVTITSERMYCVQFWVCSGQKPPSLEWRLWDTIWWNRLPDWVLEWKAMRGVNERLLLRIEEYDVLRRKGSSPRLQLRNCM